MNVLITAAVTVGLALLKGSIAVIGFLLKIITTVIRMLLCVLPITGGCLLVVSAYFIICRLQGGEVLPADFFYRPNPAYFLKSLDILGKMMNDLTAAVPGAVTVILWIAVVILAIPVLSGLLLVHAGIALLKVLIFLVPADVIVLVLLSLLKGLTPFALLRERFLMLFPAVALHRDERSYHDWLRRHGDEFREDTYGRQERGHEYAAVDDESEERGRYREQTDAYGSPDVYGHPTGRGRAERRAIRQERRRRRIEAYYDDDAYEEYRDEDSYGRAYEDAYDAPYEDAYDDEYDDTYDEQAYEEPRSRRRADTYNVHDDEEPRGRQSSRRTADSRERDAAGSAFDFFAGCRDLASVEKKYRSLVKIYHPDNQDGDTAALQEINRQYAEAKRKMR
ncbi:MAG: hypothetical protein K6B72_11245 [Lachnospiraceae bacterium]|nr:hypothetical protein [Lachnospiraceae bacterium]